MQAKADKPIWPRVGLIALLLPFCIVLPFLLIPVALMAWSVCADLRSPPHPDMPPKALRPDAEASGVGWLAMLCRDCESPAEVAFLQAMVLAFDLKPDVGVLRSPGLTLEMQVKVEGYRFDFVANGRQVIEVDGASWHSSPEQAERDRRRDAFSVKRGYRVLRIPARVVFDTPHEAIRRVRVALEGTPIYTKPQDMVSAILNRSLAQHCLSISDGAARLGREASVRLEVFNATADFTRGVSAERSGLITLAKLAEIAQQVAGMSPETRTTHDKVRTAFDERRRTATAAAPAPLPRIADWTAIVAPAPVDDPEIQQRIDAKVARVLQERDRQLADLRERCAADPGFSQHLGRKLFEAEYPVEHAIRIVPASHYAEGTVARAG